MRLDCDQASSAHRKQATMNPNGNLGRILESAVVVSWADLMRGSSYCLIHIEYGFAADGTLDNLKVWSSLTRGHWLLAYQFWLSANRFHGAGVGFENEYKSEGLAHILESVMQHQISFVLPPNRCRQGFQVPPATKEVSAAATALINIAFDHLNSAVSQPAVA